MIEILFFLFSFLVVFLSIRLSLYSDKLSKISFVNKALIGGILAGITSFPEFVTCLSAVWVDNPPLAIGDILGSNFFNIFMICFFDVFYVKKRFFLNVSKRHILIYLFLSINYLFMYLSFRGVLNVTLLGVGVPSLVIFVTYFLYVKSLKGDDNDNSSEVSDFKFKKLVLKIVLVALLLVVSSVFLTFIVNKIALSHPNFSSSLVGAILLGVVTSLPEVITFYTLLMLNSYDLALANIIGSNLFNLLVLAVSDFVLKGASIYIYADSKSFVLLILSFIINIINMIQVMRKKDKSLIFYISLSLVNILIYVGFWVVSFY